MSRPLPSRTRNPRSCTPSSIVNGTSSRQREIYRSRVAISRTSTSCRRGTSLSPRATSERKRRGARGRGWSREGVHRKRWIREDDASSQRPRGMRLGALTHWLPAKSSFFESPPRRSPHPPVRCAPRFASAAALLRRLRAGTNHFSPNFVFLLRRGRAELNVSLDGCSGGLYLDDEVLRGAYLKNREERLSPSAPAFLSLPVAFFCLLSWPNSSLFFSRPLNFTLCAPPCPRSLSSSSQFKYSWIFMTTRSALTIMHIMLRVTLLHILISAKIFDLNCVILYNLLIVFGEIMPDYWNKFYLFNFLTS